MKKFIEPKNLNVKMHTKRDLRSAAIITAIIDNHKRAKPSKLPLYNDVNAALRNHPGFIDYAYRRGMFMIIEKD